MDDARGDAVGPVVPEDLQVVRVLEGRGLSLDGQVPVQALGEDELHDAAVLLLEHPVELVVAAQAGRQALEEVQAVRGGQVLDLRPAQDVELRIGRADDLAVLDVQCGQERRAVGRALGLGDVDVPERDLFFLAAHAGVRVYIASHGWLGRSLVSVKRNGEGEVEVQPYAGRCWL